MELCLLMDSAPLTSIVRTNQRQSICQLFKGPFTAVLLRLRLR